MRRMFAWFSEKSKKRLEVVVVALALCHLAVAQGAAFSWDFSDCEIKDILFAVSVDTGISIVPDDTVSGKGDLKFAGGDFNLAFDAFLKSNRLFVKRDGEVWTVSKIRVAEENSLFTLEAYDLLPVQILEKLSEVMEKVVTYESLPAQRISICFRNVSEAVLMESLAKRFGVYGVERTEAGFHFARNNETRRGESFSGIMKIGKTADGGISVDVEDCRLSAVLNNLFSSDVSVSSDASGKRAFCLLADADSKIQRSVFIGSDFDDTLEILCAQCGYAWVVENGIYYIFTSPEVRTELVSGKRSWRKFTLRFTKSQDFFTLLFKRVGKLETISLPDDYSFLCLASERETKSIEALISEADIKLATYIVDLKYLKPSEFFEHLPPSVDRSSLFVADDSARIYFKGTEEAYKNLCAQLELCDRPPVRISYDLLILQYDESSQNNWSSSIGARRMKLGDRNGASAVLGSVMGFNLNVVTSFGLTFAAELQTSIEENKTRVYADTTLHGVSGREIHFQNTNTFRYRDNNVDPQTGTPIYSGVTREIASGIKLDVLGWVSGDGMITSKVTASVSRQGNDTSASTGNPPPTSEKLVTTEVCSKSGEPVVLSGLVQVAESQQQKGSPWISKIPVLGNLFKAKDTTKENMQMVIYLVPHLDGEPGKSGQKKYDSVWAKENMSRVIENFGRLEEMQEVEDAEEI